MADILVVDDNPVSLSIVRKLREQEGNTVTGCTDARAAIESLTVHAFDLLVTDLLMPEHDGSEVIQAAKSIRPNLRIIVLSEIDERVPPELTMQVLAKLGVARMVRKPIKPAVLASEVLAVLIAG
ncbi:response regulator [Azospirillum tabaci]|uniref:response regulator n=1 Tax=Azospirillum tabaci TaxID=2752310 RepID=UPI001661891E|nr:response regulator [Azospirillum tabaci]